MLLKPSFWYAMLLIQPGGHIVASPVWIVDVESSQRGENREHLKLSFWHASYPSGVQDKVYPLRVLSRKAGLLLAEFQDEDDPRLVLVTEITPEWHETHFRVRPDGDIQEWLERKWGHP